MGGMTCVHDVDELHHAVDVVGAKKKEISEEEIGEPVLVGGRLGRRWEKMCEHAHVCIQNAKLSVVPSASVVHVGSALEIDWPNRVIMWPGRAWWPSAARACLSLSLIHI